MTLEARAYGVARCFEPFLVNSVVGFIGPEYLYDERQIIRAGLEDHFMGKLLGLPMGCDVCYTNHADADQNSADNLLLLLGAAGCNYFMGVPSSDDVMLNYQSTSYHDALAVRRLFKLKPAPEFLAWLEARGIYREGEPALLDAPAAAPVDARARIFARGDPVTARLPDHPPDHRPDHLADDRDDRIRPPNCRKPLQKIRARTPARIFEGRAGAAYRTNVQLELRRAHAAARDAVRGELDLFGSLNEEFAHRWKLFEVQTQAAGKEEYLLRPDLGRRFTENSRKQIQERCPPASDLQIIVGDGLSVPAVSAQVPALLPLLFEGAQSRGWKVGQPFAIRYCRVGILNEIGELLDPRVAVLLIGERPGLATAESLSAYMAHRPRPGHSDSDRNLISNIHARGVATADAARSHPESGRANDVCRRERLHRKGKPPTGNRYHRSC